MDSGLDSTPVQSVGVRRPANNCPMICCRTDGRAADAVRHSLTSRGPVRGRRSMIRVDRTAPTVRYVADNDR